MLAFRSLDAERNYFGRAKERVILELNNLNKLTV